MTIRMVQSAGPLRAWALRRTTDVSGVSGTGIIAYAAELPAGGGRRLTLTRWASPAPPAGHDAPVHQTSIWGSTDEVLAVHGHGGLTQLVPLPIARGDAVRVVTLSQQRSRTGEQVVRSEDIYAYGVQWPDHRVALSIMGTRSPVHAHFEDLAQAWESAQEWSGRELHGHVLRTGPSGLWEGAAIIMPLYVPGLSQG